MLRTLRGCAGGRAISNDGSRIAFLRAGSEPGSADLFSAPSSGGEAVRVDFSCPLSSAGSLAVATQSTSSSATIEVISSSGRAPFTLAASGWLQFDSDGQFLFFDPDGFLSAASPDGVVRQIGRLSPPIPEYLGSASPDGKWFSFPTYPTGNPCINCELLEVLSAATATTWPVESAGKPLALFAHSFSPDSSSILLQTNDGKLAVVPVTGGEPRFIESDVDAASWAGPDHAVVSRSRSSPAGVHIVEVR